MDKIWIVNGSADQCEGPDLTWNVAAFDSKEAAKSFTAEANAIVKSLKGNFRDAAGRRRKFADTPLHAFDDEASNAFGPEELSYEYGWAPFNLKWTTSPNP